MAIAHEAHSVVAAGPLNRLAANSTANGQPALIAEQALAIPLHQLMEGPPALLELVDRFLDAAWQGGPVCCRRPTGTHDLFVEWLERGTFQEWTAEIAPLGRFRMLLANLYVRCNATQALDPACVYGGEGLLQDAAGRRFHVTTKNTMSEQWFKIEPLRERAAT